MTAADRLRAAAAWLQPWIVDPPLPPARGGARGRRRAAAALSLALVGIAAVAFWGTAASTSSARIAALRTVEPYALAVHEQLVRNYSYTGEFHQTIHRGYDDAWTWSGHRAPSLVIASWFYRLHPSSHWLTRIMILGVLLGAIPAALVGRRALGSPWGLALGGLLYLGSPAVMALALQDYQDLVFALPCLVFALWAFGARAWWMALVGAAVGLLPREECVPLVVTAALVTVPAVAPGRRARAWLLRVGLVAGVVGLYAAVMAWQFPLSFQGDAGGGHDTPAVNATITAVQGVFRGQLPGLEVDNGFYRLVWAPFGLIALASPLTALPGLALLVFHVTVPMGHGVDRLWGGHAHHMAPAMAFLLVATIQGAGRAMRLLREGGWRARWATAAAPRPLLARAAPWVALLVALASLGYGLVWYRSFAAWFNLVPRWLPTRPEHVHPAWALVEQLPDDAVPAVFLDASIAVSNRERAYTYEESLLDKEPTRGLGAATHMIVDKRDVAALAWGAAMPGVEVLGEEGDFALLGWTAGAADPTLPRDTGHGVGMPDEQQRMAIQEGVIPPWSPEGWARPPGVPPRGI